MTRALTPSICLGTLACMIAAVASHWWSVNQLLAVFDASSSIPKVAALQAPKPNNPKPVETTETEQPAAAVPDPAAADNPVPANPPVGEPIAMQQQFYQELIREMQHLRTQNRDLLNQVAETNRDLMKLEFRVDTHSDQFRPLPVAEDTFGTTFGTSFDDSPGLLPPRAEPVVLPFAE